MSPRRPVLLRFASEALLQSVILLLPIRERAEWLAEWRAELHYVLRSRVSHLTCLAFSLGAIPDALWIRRHARAVRLEIARSCITLLASLAALIVGTALLLPATRQQIFPAPYRGAGDLVTISPVDSVVGSAGQVSAAQYVAWSTHPHPSLSRTAFYAPATIAADLGGRRETWLVGRATENLAALLNITTSETLIRECQSTGNTPLVLSRSAWLRDFGGDRGIVGRSLRLAGRKGIIVAVAPDFASALPMHVEVWSLESDEAVAQLAAHRFNNGYMLAQTANLPGKNARGIGRVELISDDGSTARLFAIPLSALAEYQGRIPEIDFLLSLFMACLMLPALLFISLQAGLVTERLSFRMRARGWFFLIAKISLLLPLLFCGPLLIASLLAGGPASEHAIQTFTTIGGALIAAWWLLEDQRQRCPHCLRKLTSPARVGERSRSFLGFSGMEFVCAEGHGLLHVPDYPTSWFASQRWLTLDSSWRVLFQPGH